MDTTFENTVKNSFEKIQDLPFLSNLRQKAFDQFQVLGLPSTKHEEWKYTNLRNLTEQAFSPKKLDFDNTNLAQILPSWALESNLLVFVNGFFREDLSQKIDNFEVLSLSKALTENPTAQEHFAQYAIFENEALTALNTAFVNEGVFVHIAKKQAIEKPILLLHFIDSSSEILAQARQLIVCESSSQATFVEWHISRGSNESLVNVVSEIVVSQNAEISHYKIQEQGKNISQINRTQVYQQRDSRFTNLTLSLQGKLTRNNLNLVLDGENCEGNMVGLYVPSGESLIDNHTTVDHAKPHSQSNELYKGVILDKGTGIFNGKIFVRQHAQKTNAFQSNKNILLSPDATVNTKPQLEIWADDVKCSHGCTTGNLDEEPLFYLRSRGISEAKARNLLLFAFVDDVLEKISWQELRQHIENQIHDSIHQA